MSQADEKPWTEEQWEAFLKRQDLKSARFGELLETLIDDPNRNEILEKEMGWDKEDCQPIELPDLTPQEQEEIDELIKEEDDALEQIPAYQKSMEIGTKVQRLLKPLFKNNEEDPDEDISAALLGAYLPAAKIAGGHSMGYEDEVLCGNIVNNKIALAATQQCQSALKSLRDRKMLQANKVNEVLKQVEQATSLLEKRITELRAKVWWDKR